MKVTLYGYDLGGKYEWRTNTYYGVGSDDLAAHTRTPAVACRVEIRCSRWLPVLDSLLTDGVHPAVYLMDGSVSALPVVGEVQSFDAFYGR